MAADVSGIVAAAGAGTRFGRPKQLVTLHGKAVAQWAIEALGECESVGELVVACEADYVETFERLRLDGRAASLPMRVVAGGATRQASVLNALRASSDAFEYVAVHDGARPLGSSELARRVIEAARTHGSALAAVRTNDTLKEEAEQPGFVRRTLPRERCWRAQTPQAFRRALLLRAYEIAAGDGFAATDDAMLVEHAGLGVVALVEGEPDNVKITTPDDYDVAFALLERRRYARATEVTS